MSTNRRGASARRRTGAAIGSLLLVGATALTGCKASARNDFSSHTDGGGTIRCASGQAVVGETGDRDGGLLPAGAVTQARMQLYCVNEDPALAPGWSRLDVRVDLRVNGRSCSLSSWYSTTTAPEVRASTSAWCGAGSYQAVGSHAARPAGSGTSATGTSATESVDVS